METVIIQVKDREDIHKLRQISASNGWLVQSGGDLLRWLIDNAPQDVPLTGDDIMDEIRQAMPVMDIKTSCYLCTFFKSKMQ
jgi:hypothetical protein